MSIESYAHVHHIVSNVRGDAAREVTPVGALRAVFPGGTITGVPEVPLHADHRRARGRGRGAYTGSLGYLTPRRATGPEHPDPHHDAAGRARCASSRRRASSPTPIRSANWRRRAPRRAACWPRSARRRERAAPLRRAYWVNGRRGAQRVGARPRAAVRRRTVRDHRLPRRAAALPRPAPGAPGGRLRSACGCPAAATRAAARRDRRGARGRCPRAVAEADRDARRGAGARLCGPRGDEHPTRILLRYPLAAGGCAAAARRACACGSARCGSGRTRALAGLKHLNRLEQVLARQEWSRSGDRRGAALQQQRRADLRHA